MLAVNVLNSAAYTFLSLSACVWLCTSLTLVIAIWNAPKCLFFSVPMRGMKTEAASTVEELRKSPTRSLTAAFLGQLHVCVELLGVGGLGG